jgi:RecA-family ATPase
MLLSPILPERSLAMLYAPRGVGKACLGLSIGLSVASGSPLLRWFAPRQRNVIFVDGEMPLVSLQERLKAISVGFGRDIPNDRFGILAANSAEGGINLSTEEEGQHSLKPLLEDIDLLILDNLSTLCTSSSESASDAWVPMQNWLLKLRRQRVSVLLVDHAGTNGRQRGTSTLWIPSLPYADRKIIRLRKEPGSRFIWKNFSTERTVMVRFRSKQAFSHLSVMDKRASAGVHTT